MQICLLSDVFRRVDIRAALPAIARAGFSAIELNACHNWDPHLDLNRSTWEADLASIRLHADAVVLSCVIP